MRVTVNRQRGRSHFAASAPSDAQVKREIVKVARAHEPDGGYGETAWHAGTKTVFWVSADWTSNEEHDAAWEAFLAIDGVENMDGEAEAGLPSGDGWVRLWPEPSAKADIDDLLALAAAPLDLDSEWDPDRDGWEGKPDPPAAIAELVASAAVGTSIDTAAFTSALEALAHAHKSTTEGVAAVLAMAVKHGARGNTDELTMKALQVLEQFATRPDPEPTPITVNLPPSQVTVEGAIVNIPEQQAPNVLVEVAAAEAPAVHVHVPEPAAVEAPIVNVTMPEQKIDVHVAPLEAHIDVHVPEQAPPRSVRVEYDADGTKRFVQE